MKILLLSTSLNGGGAERIIQLLSDFLLSRGHAVTVAGLDRDSPDYRWSPRVDRFHFVSGVFNKGFLKILLLPLQALELVLRIRRSKPDAVVSFLVRANLVNALAGCFGVDRPIILSHRNITQGLYGGGGISDRLMLMLLGLLYPRADRIIAISTGVKTSLEALGIAPCLITVIPNFIDHRLIEKTPRASLEIAGDKPVIVSTGRLVAQKDFATLLRAFARVRARLDACLVIIGAGPLEKSLKQLALDLGVAADVLFTGWLSDPFGVMRRADLFVLCSRYEGFGNVIIEAMACGLPVICTDCPGGPREILADGDHGRLVPVGDVPGIADSILEVLRNPALRERMRRQSVLRAGDYRMEILAPGYLRVMETLQRHRQGPVKPTAHAGRSDADGCPGC